MAYDDLERDWECNDPEREAMDYEFNARFDRWDGYDSDGFDDPDDFAADTRWLDDNDDNDFEALTPDVPVVPIVLGFDDVPF